MNRVDFSMEEYQVNVLRTANRQLDWNQTLENCLLGLAGELAEVVAELNTDSKILQTVTGFGQACEAVKKIKYHGKSTTLLEHLSRDEFTVAEQSLKRASFQPKNANLVKELGDVMYYLFWLIDTLGLEASEVAQVNVEKLRKRYSEGFSVEASLKRDV